MKEERLMEIRRKRERGSGLNGEYFAGSRLHLLRRLIDHESSGVLVEEGDRTKPIEDIGLRKGLNS